MKIRDMVIKELKIAFSDRALIIELIIMPIVLMTILGYSLTFSFGSSANMDKLNIAVVKNYDLEEEKESLLKLIPANSNIDIYDIDFDEFNMDKVFFDDFLGNKELKDIIEYQIMTEDEAIEKLEGKEITAIVILPKGFIKDIMINYGTSFRNIVDIKIIGRTENNINSTIIEEVMKSFTEVMNFNISAKNSFIKVYNRESINDKIEDHMDILLDKINSVLETERTVLKYEQLNNRPPMNSRAYYAFGMTAMFILFGAGYGSKLLLEEKRMGTYDRMSASGVKKSMIVIGKASTIFLIVLAQMIVSYIFSTLFLDVDWGSVANLMLIFAASAFSVAGLGMLLSAIVYIQGSYNIGNLFSTFIIQILSVLSGSMIPIDVMPDFAKYVSNLIPNGLMMKALMKNYYGYRLSEFIGSLCLIFMYGIIFAIIAIFLLQKKVRRSNHEKHIDAKADAI